MPLQYPQQMRVDTHNGIVRSSSGLGTSSFDKRADKNIALINLKRFELRDIRHKSLLATRRGDYMGVARLTTRAAQLNKEILNLQIGIEDNFVSH